MSSELEKTGTNESGSFRLLIILTKKPLNNFKLKLLADLSLVRPDHSTPKLRI